MTTAALQHTIEQPSMGEVSSEYDDSCAWPSLASSSKGTSKQREEWEMIATPDGAPDPNPPAAEVEFESEAIFLKSQNPKCLKHCVSSPNLGGFELDVVSEDSVASSSSSPWSAGKVSFRDAILLGGNKSKPANNDATSNPPKDTTKKTPHLRKVKPKFVVAPIKRCTKSTGDLKSLVIHEDDEEVLGDTDANEYYNRKAAGKIGRKNGMKTRPDEAKRLQLIMNKKNMQRRSQGR